MHPSVYKDLSPADAIAYQHKLAKNINLSPLNKEVNLVAGADISFNKNEDTVYAGIIVLSYPDMKKVTEITVISQALFPYISGLLAFREIPALLEAWDKLTVKPDIMILDGQGIAHERRMGIATHFGLLTDMPSIGCAKSRLAGKYEQPGENKFDESALIHRNEQVGVAFRTKLKCKPVFISPGHKVSILQSVEIIKNCTKKHRIPEPTRLAHLLVNEARIKAGNNLKGQQSLF